MELGGNGYDFAGDYGTKGCYAYNDGKYSNKVYYGNGGTEEQMTTSLEDPKYRPDGHDCSSEGLLVICHVLFTKNYINFYTYQ